MFPIYLLTFLSWTEMIKKLRSVWSPSSRMACWTKHDDVIKWKHFPQFRALCAGNSPVPVNSPHKGQWRGALMFSLICAWINDWVNNREAGYLRRHRGHYDVNVMDQQDGSSWGQCPEFWSYEYWNTIIHTCSLINWACIWLNCQHIP